MTPGTIDDFPYVFVHSDRAIALYRTMRAEDSKANRKLANAPTPVDSSSAAEHGTAAATAAAAAN